VENSTFFWRGHGQKNTAQNLPKLPKHAISSDFFLRRGLAPSQISHFWGGLPLLTPTSGPQTSLLHQPLRFSRITARSTPLSLCRYIFIFIHHNGRNTNKQKEKNYLTKQKKRKKWITCPYIGPSQHINMYIRKRRSIVQQRLLKSATSSHNCY